MGISKWLKIEYFVVQSIGIQVTEQLTATANSTTAGANYRSARTSTYVLVLVVGTRVLVQVPVFVP